MRRSTKSNDQRSERSSEAMMITRWQERLVTTFPLMRTSSVSNLETEIVGHFKMVRSY